MTDFTIFFRPNMNLSKYYYNPETCRYEPKGTAYASILGYAVLFAVTTVVIFVGILFAHSKLFLTERGKELKKENQTFEKHFASLQQQASVLESSIANLNEKNAALHQKLFDAPIEQTQTKQTSTKANLLLADAESFRKEFNTVTQQAESNKQTAISHNIEIEGFGLRKKEKVFLLSVPSIMPVENTEDSKLASGFGVRVNPFHKGNYHHPGVDFTTSRGSKVFATASGRVLRAVKSSDLQAGYGNYVDIEHANGLVTRYAHLDNVTVHPAQRIEKGAVIGTVGMTGGTVAPHVHYEIIRKGEQVDPLPYMLEGITSNQYTELQKLGAKKNQSLD